MGEISKELKPPTRKMEKSLSLKKKKPTISYEARSRKLH